MTVTRKKRPRDPLQLAKLIGDIATGQVEDREDDGKDPNAAALGRKGGAAKPLGAGEAQLPGNLHHVAERQPECQRHEEQAHETQNLQHHWRSSTYTGAASWTVRTDGTVY